MPDFLIVNNFVSSELCRNMTAPARRLFATRFRRAIVIFSVLVFVRLLDPNPARATQDSAQAPWGRVITSAAIACNPSTHKVYAVNEGAGSVMVVDAATGVTRSVDVGREPIAIAVNHLTNRIYVANAGGGSISVIDGTSDTVIATVAVERLPYTLAVNERANKIYVTHTYSNAVTEIDGSTNTADLLKVGSADGVAVDSRTTTIFLTTYEDPNIRVVNGKTNEMRRVSVGPHIWGMVFDERSTTLFLAHTSTGEVVAINEKTHDVSTISVGKIPCALAVNPVTHRLYVVNYGDETMSVIDIMTKQVVATLPVGKHPQGVAVDSKANRIYVANVHDDNVTLIDGARNTVIGVRSAGKAPYAVAVDEASGRAYAANYGAPWVTPVALDK